MHIVDSHAFHCEICNLVCTSIVNLKEHFQTHSGGQKSPVGQQGETIKCDQCDFATKCVKDYVTHLLGDHIKKNIYKCSFCEYTAKDQQDLDVHIGKYHDMLVVMKSFAENQVSLMQKFDNLKDEMKTAMNQIIDDNNTMKQELFILRQSQTVNKTTVQSAPSVHDNVTITDPPSLPKPPTAKRDDKENGKKHRKTTIKK